jgi:hypothetical protein
MSRRQPRFWKHVKGLVILASVAAALGLLTPAGARAQGTTPWVTTTWTVHIDVTHQGGAHKPKPDYKYSRSTGSCPDSQPYPAPLSVCDGDTVHWAVMSNKGKDSLHLLLGSFILADSAGHPTVLFQADDGTPTDGGKTVNGPNSGVEYYLIVRDKDDGHEYPDDPKIIIGTGSLQSQASEQLYALEKNTEQLQDWVAKNPALTKGTEAEAEKDLEQLRRIIEKLRKDLRAQ